MSKINMKSNEYSARINDVPDGENPKINKVGSSVGYIGVIPEDEQEIADEIMGGIKNVIYSVCSKRGIDEDIIFDSIKVNNNLDSISNTIIRIFRNSEAVEGYKKLNESTKHYKSLDE